MNNWAGIKPKVLNQNKALAQKNNPKNKLTTNATQNRSKKDKELEEEVEKAVQQLIAMNKADEARNSDQQPEYDEDDNLQTPEVSQGVSNPLIKKSNGFKTPENSKPSVMFANIEQAKNMKKSGASKRVIVKRSELEQPLLEYDDHMEDIGYPASSKRPRNNQELVDNEIDDNLQGDFVGVATNSVSRYAKVEGGEGCILSAFYTEGQDEQLKKFVPLYVNIGNRFQAKELIGIRKNTKFVTTSTSKKSKSAEDHPNYLVVSFENRKKANSIFMEYPLNRLHTIIVALQELKNAAINSGHYNEKAVSLASMPRTQKYIPAITRILFWK